MTHSLNGELLRRCVKNTVRKIILNKVSFLPTTLKVYFDDKGVYSDDKHITIIEGK